MNLTQLIFTNNLSDLIGFFALGVSLFAFTQKHIKMLRIWHLLSSSIYVFYGCLIASAPIVIGAILYCLIHAWKLYRLNTIKTN
jgi:formate hydrogenlyase subunit 3/multisubunit Na+/H+ antiporter MnhD subunit